MGPGLTGRFYSCDGGCRSPPSVPESLVPHTLPALASIEFYPTALICFLFIPTQHFICV